MVRVDVEDVEGEGADDLVARPRPRDVDGDLGRPGGLARQHGHLAHEERGQVRARDRGRRRDAAVLLRHLEQLQRLARLARPAQRLLVARVQGEQAAIDLQRAPVLPEAGQDLAQAHEDLALLLGIGFQDSRRFLGLAPLHEQVGQGQPGLRHLGRRLQHVPILRDRGVRVARGHGVPGGPDPTLRHLQPHVREPAADGVVGGVEAGRAPEMLQRGLAVARTQRGRGGPHQSGHVVGAARQDGRERARRLRRPFLPQQGVAHARLRGHRPRMLPQQVAQSLLRVRASSGQDQAPGALDVPAFVGRELGRRPAREYVVVGVAGTGLGPRRRRTRGEGDDRSEDDEADRRARRRA